MKWLLVFLVVISSGFFFLFPKDEKKLTIAVAANAQYAIEELKSIYEKETGIKIELIKGASGKLTTQIKEGADYDLFLSADTTYPYILYQNGFAAERPYVYGFGSLVCWTMNVKGKSVDEILINADKIAIANPKLAPYGKAAMEMLYHNHLFDKVESKVVYGESLSQVNHFFVSGAADVCLTSRSLMVSVETKGKGRWIELDPSTYSPIAQAVVLINRKDDVVDAEAGKFYYFLSSEKAKNVFRKYGYIVK